MESLREFLDNEYKKRNIKKIGDCKHCGACCIGNIKVYEIWYGGDGKNTVRLKRTEENPCGSYDNIAKRCIKYDDRTEWCTLFPYLPENIFEGCGYEFIRVENKIGGLE